MIYIPQPTEVETFTGLYFDTIMPSPESVDLMDIAHGLGNTCRYGGQCREFYSVAEHAVLCAWYAKEQGWPIEDQIAALHHDSAEAYLGDIPRPFKPLLGPRYVKMTELADIAIIKALGLPFGVEALRSPLVHEVDSWALLEEAKILLPSKGEGWTGNTACAWDLDEDENRESPPPDFPFGLRPHAAKGIFLATHHDLMQEHAHA